MEFGCQARWFWRMYGCGITDHVPPLALLSAAHAASYREKAMHRQRQVIKVTITTPKRFSMHSTTIRSEAPYDWGRNCTGLVSGLSASGETFQNDMF
jgi:hypothetical protein